VFTVAWEVLSSQRSRLMRACSHELMRAVMSANERTETVFECIRGGAEDYLLKPVTRKEVQHMWQHVWRRQQQNALRVPHMCPEEVGPLLALLEHLAGVCLDRGAIYTYPWPGDVCGRSEA